MNWSELTGILTGFYDDDKVSLAKDVLFNTVDKISPMIDGLPSFRIRKDSVNKRRLDCEDIVNLVEFLDKKNIQPPVFHAVITIRYRLCSNGRNYCCAEGTGD